MQRNAAPQARILIVDDQPANVTLLERLLSASGYTDRHSTTDSRQVLDLTETLQPDIILLDLHMPHLDGFAVLDQLRTVIPAEDFLPVLVLTADITPRVRQRALELGANDFLAKPFDVTEVLLRIRNLLATRSLHRRLQDHNQELEAKVQERTRALEAAHVEILARLAQAAEYRDDLTGEHIHRVGHAAARMAHDLGLPEDEVELIRRAAPLHDVGKIGIPDHILLKPGRLTAEETVVMQTHATIGARMLAGSEHPLLHMAETIALTHHERWDGVGYPRGLQGEAIPLEGRIVAVADVFDALTAERPYKAAWTVADAVAEIARQSGCQFDPAVVAVFLQVHPDQHRADHGAPAGPPDVAGADGGAECPESRRDGAGPAPHGGSGWSPDA